VPHGKWSKHRIRCVPERSRTSGLPLRRRLLYPAELLGQCRRAV
jgi:hypothetical protein